MYFENISILLSKYQTYKKKQTLYVTAPMTITQKRVGCKEQKNTNQTQCGNRESDA